jgi:hypothetical protein
MLSPGTYTLLPITNGEIYEVRHTGPYTAFFIDPQYSRPAVVLTNDGATNIGYYMLNTNETAFELQDLVITDFVTVPWWIAPFEGKLFETPYGNYSTAGVYIDENNSHSLIKYDRTFVPIPTPPDIDPLSAPNWYWDHIWIETSATAPIVENEFWTEEDQCVEATYEY